MAYPLYNQVTKIDPYTDPVSKNKGVVIFGSQGGATGSVVLGFFDQNGETGTVAGNDASGNSPTDGVAGITAEVPVGIGDTLFIPIRVGNVGGITNCFVKAIH
mgnify:FL=1